MQARNRGHHQIVNRIGAHRGQRIDLFGHTHRSQHGCHRATDATGQHRCSQHRAKFLYQRAVDDHAQTAVQTDRVELCIALHGQHHADEGSRQRDHRQTEYADLIEVDQHRAATGHPREHPAEHLPREQRHVADRCDPINDRRTPLVDPSDQRRFACRQADSIRKQPTRTTASKPSTSCACKQPDTSDCIGRRTLRIRESSLAPSCGLSGRAYANCNRGSSNPKRFIFL